MTTPFIVSAPARLSAPPPELAVFADHLADPEVTDIFINGDQGLYVLRAGRSARDERWRASEREVRELAVELIAAGGRHIDDAHPCVDVRVAGGIRIHAVLAPVAARGTAISIRVPRWVRPDLDDLAAGAMFDDGVLDALRAAVARRANFLISGAAGAGKTTLLSALLAEADAGERIVTIEDVAEIRLDHPHHVALEARQANLEGAGSVDLAMLVREALRMKPDRLIIGECRGAEVRELLTALNTGHDGGAGTVHANGLTEVPARLEALGALAGLDDRALARQVVSAIEFVVHVECDRAGRRRVAGLGRLSLDADGRLSVTRRAVENTRRAARRSGTVPDVTADMDPHVDEISRSVEAQHTESHASHEAVEPVPDDSAEPPRSAAEVRTVPARTDHLAGGGSPLHDVAAVRDAFDAIIRGDALDRAVDPADGAPTQPTAARFVPRPPDAPGAGRAAA